MQSLDPYCDSYWELTSGLEEAGALMDCYAKMMTAADCSSPEAYAAAISSLSSCL